MTFEGREDFEEKENPIKVGITSLQLCQYSKKAVDFQRPCTITMKGSTPSDRRWVVPPILKPWPVGHPRFEVDQISLHLVMIQDLWMGAWPPFEFSKLNR